MKPQKKVIKDAQGAKHEYICRPFEFDEGFPLKLELLDIVSEAFGLGIDAIFDAESDVLVDMHKLGKALAMLPKGIMRRGDVALVRRLLANTIRDRKHGKKRVKEQLDEETISRVYAANYAECYQALAFVIEANYGPFSAESMGQWKPLLQKVKGFFQKMTTQKSASESLTSEPPADE